MHGVRTVLVVLLVGGAACGAAADAETPITPPPPPPVSDAEVNASPSEAGAAPDPCDAVSLAERHSLAGCRFVTTFAAGESPVLATRLPAACYAIIVSNPSNERARLRLRFRAPDSDGAREDDASPYTRRAIVDGRRVRYEPLDDGALGPRESAVVSAVRVPASDPSLPSRSDCPSAGFVESEAPAARDGRVTPGLELVADRPVVAAQVSLYVPDVVEGSLPIQLPHPLVPVHLWETTPTETGVFKPGLPPSFSVELEDEDGEPFVHTWNTSPAHTFALAAFDDTVVSLPHADGMLSEGTLQRGEVFAHVTSDALAGRFAIADKPVALATYAPQAYIPWEFSHELGIDWQPMITMALPSTAWGSEYVAAPHGERWEGQPEEVVWRMIGGSDGTVLTYEPSRPPGAPTSLARGELAVFFATEAFVVRSQDGAHSFYMSESMTGASYQLERQGIREKGRGGSVTVHQLASSLWARRYAFFAVPGIPEQSLVLVRPRKGGDVRLDCAGVVTGWTPVGDRFELARVALSGRLYEPIDYPDAGSCQAGGHWIEGDGPFWGTLWGWASPETFDAFGVRVDGAYALPLLPSAVD